LPGDLHLIRVDGGQFYSGGCHPQIKIPQAFIAVAVFHDYRRFDKPFLLQIQSVGISCGTTTTSCIKVHMKRLHEASRSANLFDLGCGSCREQV
jgi:hypothetical protein